jgi:PAS domain S-box-containing protein
MPYRILMIDNDEEDFLHLKGLLEKIEGQPYTLDWLRHWEEETDPDCFRRYDVVLVEYQLSAKTGTELIRQLKSANYNAAFILLASSDDPRIDAEARAAGALDMIVKRNSSAKDLDRSLRYSVAHSRDMTAVKKLIASLQEQIEERNAALERTHAFQRAILEKAGAMIIATDPTGIITLFNPAAERELGYTAVELIGQKTPLCFHEPTQLARRTEEFSKELNIDIRPGFEVFAAKARRALPNTHEWEYVRKDGSFFPVTLTVTAIQDPGGNIIGFIGVAMNIAGRKMMEAEMLRSLERERELGEMKSRFVSMASHEFRTPLTSIASSAELMEAYVQRGDYDKVSKHADRIKHCVGDMNAILAEFLSLSKLEEGKTQAHFREMNLPELVTDVQDEFKHLLKPGQTIGYEHKGPEIVLLDPMLLKNVLINLISNASKYSPSNASVQVTTTVAPEKIMLRVTDRGIGIPPEDQTRLFDRFYRAHNATNIQGTGLGLYIVKNYVEMMRGAIGCDSVLGKGSTFWVDFFR